VTERDGASAEPIAIVGMAALFPEASDLRAFWENIVGGRDCISEVPPSRWRLEDHYDPDPSAPDRTYSRRGGFVPDIEFDPIEWGLPPNSLEVTDVTQLISLVLARRAFADAGYGEGGRSFDRERTGVVLGVGGGQKLITPLTSRLQEPVWRRALETSGVSGPLADLVVEKIAAAYVGWEEDSFPGMLGNVIAGRIANRFDLGGVNCVVDAACAASFAALKMAVGELADGSADMMLTGGVDADNSPFMYLCFSKTPAFSRTDRIRPFDAESDGMLVGEGLGMLVLKRHADAIRDEDRVYAIIRGLGASSDGRFKSIYAPRSEGQERALRRAYAAAGVAPASIGLVEAHGTGTEAGDLCEAATLHRVFGDGSGTAAPSIAIGSVKSQIGHTKAAAGAAGLIKAALALHHKVLPPTINVERPNPALGLDGSPLYVNVLARPWPRRARDEPRRAGVSAFGFGGTNFHVVLEEDEREQRGPYRLDGSAREILVVATTPRELAERCSALASAARLGATIGELAESAGIGDISPGDARLGLVAADPVACAELLEGAARRLGSDPEAEAWSLQTTVHYRRRAFTAAGAVAAIFPGQGSQYVGMARTVALAFPPVRERLAQADALFRADGRGLLSDVVYPPAAFDEAGRTAQEERLRTTDLAQPAIGAVSAGLYDVLRDAAFAPDFVAGHSFGELTALWAAGSLDDAAFARLARERGRALAGAAGEDAGAMLAVHADASTVAALLDGADEVVVANVNAPDQVVLAGPTARVAQVRDLLAERGIATFPLAVAAAFHTPLVAEAQAPFAEAVRASLMQEPAVPVFATATGAPYPRDPEGVAAVLSEQLVQPVRWADQVEGLYAAGARVFVEVGPRRVLTGLVRRILGERPHATIPLDGGPDVPGDNALRDAAVQLRVLGVRLGEIDAYRRADEPETDRSEGRGRLTIRLNGANYVSERTRSAYEATLARTTTTTTDEEPADVTTEPSHDSAADGERARLLSLLEAGMAQIHEQQRELAQLQRQVLETQHDLSRELLERGTAPAGSLHVELLGAVQRQQGAVLQQHDAFVAHQTRFAEALLAELGRQAAALVGESVVPREPAQAVATTSAHLAADAIPAEPVGPATASATAPAAAAAELEALTPPASSVAAANGATQTAAAPPGAFVDLERAMLEVVSEKTGYPVATLELDMDMEADLGIDSIKRVQILGAMQARFPDLPPLRPDELAPLRTLAEVANYVHLQAAAAPSPEGHSATAGGGVPVAEPRLRPLPPADTLEVTAPVGYCAVVTDEGTEVTRAVAKRLLLRGWPTVVLRFPPEVAPLRSTIPDGAGEESLATLDEAGVDEALDRLVAKHGPIGTFVHLHPRARGAELVKPTQEELLKGVFLVSTRLRRSLEESARLGRGSFLVVTRLDGALGTDSAADDVDPGGGGLYGLAKTIRREWPAVFARAVDVAPGLDHETAADAVLAELSDPDERLVEVGHGPGGRVTLAVEAMPAATG
jgi:acyl transferase domain-containing protein